MIAWILNPFDKPGVRSSKSSKNACGFCDLSPTHETPQGQFLKLKGICKTDLWTFYDINYYVHGIYDGRPLFKGCTVKVYSLIDVVFKILLHLKWPWGVFISFIPFTGTTISYIHYNMTDERWYLRSLVDPEKYLVTVKQIPEELPTGTW